MNPASQPPGGRRFRVLDELGRGGFGTVYKAEMTSAGGFRKIVALKTLSQDVTTSSMAAVRLRDEARMLGLLRHPALVAVDGLIEIDGGWAVVMEFVEGADLNALLKRGPLPVRVALEIVAAVGFALEAAWLAHGPDGAPLRLIHRDVKPANIRVTPAGAVKLLDFGIARAEFEAREVHSATGLMGTVGYMSPERIEGQDGPEGDVYALGCVLYQLLTGEMVQRASGDRVRHQGRVGESMERLGRALPHTAFEAVDLVGRALHHDPGGRPTALAFAQIAEGLADDLRGERLRQWAAREVPLADVGRPASSGRVGATAVERSVDTFGWVGSEIPSSIPPGLSPPAPEVRSPSARSAMLGVVLGLQVCGGGLAVIFGAWWIFRPEAAAPEPVASELVAPEPAAPELAAPEPAAPEPAAPELAAPEPAAPEPAAPEPAAPELAAPEPPVVVPSVTVIPTQAESTVGHVVVTGDPASVELISVSTGAVFPPGDVPPGTYKVRAIFPDGPTTTRSEPITVVAGSTVLNINCMWKPVYSCKPI